MAEVKRYYKPNPQFIPPSAHYAKIFKQLDNMSSIERYAICCRLVGKEATDEYVRKMRSPLRRAWARIKWRLRK